ncbi:MAG TPA: hypothetical protein VF178_11585, partial [Gemmatimonadaceae bacterium]
MRLRAILLATLVAVAAPLRAQNTPTYQTGVDAREYVVPLTPLLASGGPQQSELRDIVARYTTDANALGRRWHVDWSPMRRERMRQFYLGWQARLRELDFDRLGQQGRIDYILLNHTLRHELSLLDREEKFFAEAEPLVPFAKAVFDLMDARRRMEPIDPPAAARTLVEITKEVERVQRAVLAGLQQSDSSGGRRGGSGQARDSARTGASRPGVDTAVKPIKTTKVIAHRSSQIVNELKTTLTQWYNFYSGYDPLFTWWARDPYRRADSIITAY